MPRFHLTWGTGPGVVAPFAERVEAHIEAGLIQPRFRHQVSHIITQGGIVKGVSGEVLASDDAPQGARTNRQEIGEFEVYAPSVLVASGGIGGNLDAVRKNWPVDRLGPAPRRMVSGVPFHVDGRMIPITEAAGGHVINADRMWHYTEGLRNWDPIWPNHGIRILPGPSSMWFDARGDRLPAPYLPGFDTLGTLREILKTGQDYSWFILSQKIIQKEFALSGSEQNPDLTAGKWGEVLRARLLSRGKAPAPVEAFKKHGADFVVADTLSELVAGMNELGELPLEETHLRRQIEARDAQADNPFAKDAQLIAINAARNYRGDRLIRTAKPHRLLDRANGPLIAVRLNILTRKSLGGLQTDLDGQLIGADGATVPGLFAAGEVAGFGGGGYHGYNALEGSFLGGCLFTGRQAGQSRAIA
ncbi:fumarate reductase/succinate dehydrogenase flavoprotein-like protein [Phaeobacter porticola]|uniref:Fumarate reductase/succinate dehydrogenase flavoprotein-like protein n=1 Tax=Phaeobacter porticola TaxID=1844006 RepID=A0A1L3I601_9RHOB|nr:fumarate reductase/succinate dehydrogenase flavoprotein-like protein [Phaeobacter porticola]